MAEEFDEQSVRRAAESGDADAIVELATRIEAEARRLQRDARAWFERGMQAGSLDATHAVVRLAVADRKYDYARVLLLEAQRTHERQPADRFVSVAPDVLGGELALDSDDSHDEGDATFTVIAGFGHERRAAAACARVAPRLMDVDEFGVEKSFEEREQEWEPGTEEPYMPNFLSDVRWNRYGALVHLDTKGGLTAAMGRAMVGILVEALVADEIPAHIAGHLPDLIPERWVVWTDPDASE